MLDTSKRVFVARSALANTIALVLLVAFLSASFLGSFHLALCHSDHAEELCPYCKYSQLSVDIPVAANLCVFVPVAATSPPICFAGGGFFAVPPSEPRAPPSA